MLLQAAETFALKHPRIDLNESVCIIAALSHNIGGLCSSRSPVKWKLGPHATIGNTKLPVPHMRLSYARGAPGSHPQRMVN